MAKRTSRLNSGPNDDRAASGDYGDYGDYGARRSRTPRPERRRENAPPVPRAMTPLLPKTPAQERLLRALRHSDQVFVIGPPGTGKSYLPVCFGADLLQSGEIDTIVLTRPIIPVSSSQRLGFRPGTAEEKMAEWTAELFAALRGRMGAGAFGIALKRGNVSVVPFETMRGRTFSRSFVLLDEGQNVTYPEMKMFLTRIGERSRMVVNGDLSQSDLREESGLAVALRINRAFDLDVPVIEFGLDDIVRGGTCAAWTRACYRYEQDDAR